jgi:hypothetical protein
MYPKEGIISRNESVHLKNILFKKNKYISSICNAVVLERMGNKKEVITLEYLGHMRNDNKNKLFYSIL